ncbi:MAG: asparagine synthase (glutamine-hydrolyzing) [Blastocatellia bacterium]|nr:asparagine synthase (glutamine-hydrolyzing) [Blastocatellia bacterium]
MCGIAGLLLNSTSSSIAVDRVARLDTMVEALTHRGPDDRGARVEDRIAIGMRRLSIIDTAGGHQPISNEDGTVWIVYNGECYNFLELRDELVSSGHRFTTRSDTEVMVHGYEQWGICGLAERLNGIFAFCIWDANARKAFLVRDRLGVKPLYYSSRTPALAFSSELRSLAHSGLLLPKLDEEAVWTYLFYQYPPTSRTLVAGAERLPAAHILEWSADTGATRVSRYWDFPEGGERDDLTMADAAHELAELLDDAVHRQMIADVPIGCFLSGGLDSSLVAALIAKHSSHAVRTFSIGFPNAGWYDETNEAERVAKHIGAEHTTIAFEEDAFLSKIDAYLGSVDEPVADAAMLPTDVLSEHAAREVKVVLTGEGADEVFGGYEYYRPFVFGAAPPPRGARAARNGALAHVRREFEARVGTGMPAPVRDLSSAVSGFPYTVQPEFLWCLLGPDRRPSLEVFRGALARVESDLLPSTTTHTALQRALYVDTRLWLGHDLMTKLDKATMAHSLEGRVPLLDHRIVEFAFRLPDRFKVGREHGKLVLREAVRGMLPDDIVDREKHGFGVPIAAWFRGRLHDYVRDVLLDSALVEDGLFTRQAMEAILVAHADLDVDMSRTIWAIVNLDRWWRAIRAEIVAALPVDGAIPVVSRDREPTVDILIPIYENFSLVRDCVRSIRTFTTMPFRAILLDDRSSDATFAKLDELVTGDDRFELVRNDENLGFVANCNRGFERCSADYVVLLNSDTVVAPGWLERMVACAESDPAIAIVNPLTNESGNTSVRFAPGLNLLTMAKVIADGSPREYPDITTAVGMCLLVRRAALEMFGTFDPVYLNAYCEESDLCMRLTEAGLRVVAADDAFIYHKGWASYDEAKKNRYYEHNRAIFDTRWSVPFDRDWGRYSRHDPLQPTRNRLLRFALSPDDAEDRDTIVERRARLSTSATLHAVAEGSRIAAASTLISRPSPALGKHEFDSYLQRRMATPLVKFEDRALAMPTADTIRTLPSLGRDKLRITFLVASLPLAGGIISIVQLAREMLLAGHDVRIATEAHEDTPERLNLWLQPLVYRDKRHLIEDFPESDVVVATFWVTAHQYMRALRERHEFASVYFIQDYESWFYPESDWLHRNNVIHSYARTEHHIVKSRWLADMVDRHGPRCEIVPLGLDLGVFYPRGERPPSRPRVVSVAAVGPEGGRRGFADTIEAFRRIHEARPDVELVFYGAERDQLPELPFDVTVAGRIYDQNKVAALMSSADVVLDASLWQGFGRPGLEAMACGTVPVLTNIGGLTEYARDGENSVLVPPGDPAAAAKAILELIDDPARYGRLRASALETSERFSHVDEARRHLELYTRWVSEKFPSRGRELSTE